MCVCVSSTKQCSGWWWGVLLATFMCVSTGVHMCESAYVHMSAHYTWLFFPDQALCSTLHDLQYYEPSRRLFLDSEFGRRRVLGSQGHRGELATARCYASFSVSAVYNSARRPVGQGSQV